MRLVAPLAVVVLIAGCGGEPRAPSAETQIRAAYATFAKALHDGDGAAMCRVSTQEIRNAFIVAAAQLGKPSPSCVTAFESISDEIPPGEFLLTEIAVSGDSARGRNPKAVDADDRVVEFSRIGGKWYVGS